MAKVDKTYRTLIEQIVLDNEAFSDEEMKSVYKEQKKSLNELHALLGTLFITYGVNGLLKLTSTQKANLGIAKTLKTMGKDLGDIEVEKITSIISDVYKDTYYKNAFVMDSGLKIDLKFNILKKEYVDAVVNAKYKGELFSDRIWKNKADMIDKLQSSLTEAMQGNTTIDKIARDIKETFNTTAYESSRLVRTENARVQSQAIDDIANSTGVEQQMYSATLDMITNPVDASFDSNVYEVNDESKPEIPLHPNCRCCYINIPYEGWTPTQRKDNISKELIDNTDYKTWAKEKGID